MENGQNNKDKALTNLNGQQRKKTQTQNIHKLIRTSDKAQSQIKTRWQKI